MHFLRALAGLILVLPLAAGAELNTLKGKKIAGDLVSADDKTIVIKTAGGDVATPVPEAMQLTLSTAPAPKFPEKYIDVELIDGSLLHCAAFSLKGKQVELTILPNVKLTIPMSVVAYILNDAQDAKTQKEWQEVIADRGKRDRFFVHKDNRMDGLDGTFGDADPDGKQITFDLANGTRRKLPLDRLAALLFNNRLEGNIPPIVCRVNDLHKNIIVANKANVKDGKLTLTTVAGVTIEYPALQQVAMLDYSQDKVAYLSELKFKEENLFAESTVQCSRDHNLDGLPIQLEGVTYPHGLVVHAGMILTFDIGGDYKEFKTILGFDPSASLVSNVKVTFEGDGRPLFGTEVKIKDKPQPLTLDIKKVKQLRIIVSASEGLFIGRQITMADAKVSK